jgi:caffeoyl-CoA O-methyltransferase
MALHADQLDHYCTAHSQTTSTVLQELHEATHARTDMPIMLVGPLEASFLRMLVSLTGAQRILEIGTFTGYSALAMAEALPDHGELITLDVSAETTAIGQEYWEKSPHGHKIHLQLGSALESLQHIEGNFDLIFIDADKDNYPHYWEACVPRLNPGGLLIVDNVFLGGRVLAPEIDAAIAVDTMNKMAQADPRVECSMLTVRDGVLLARRL